MRRGRRNDDDVGPARELDVTHGGFCRLVPEVVAYTLAGYGLERQGADELSRAARHDYLDFAASLDEAPNELGRLVRRDSARHADQHSRCAFSDCHGHSRAELTLASSRPA